ncbi:iduronate 2-sulfatase-like isoform X2 [Sycon ciliatum]|uniref:iduronate 2-sulfatase-like isoform X2 n=1 Tax=Sycon ciliatum TaxID=27933 RepID=UPI0031F62886|eukprot:scpid63271/ scgid1234/ Iduronate 2-sulfatase; Alpha-L-iduronate sulfate sulfatase; Iduronate 2-sulfatase 42 kDa chain; Iduronate 2-sulfatase 14 kDa chain
MTLSEAGKVLAPRKNVLFFAIDDLRPDLGAYGADFVISPNIDKLAKRSLLFERAYCQVSFCSPSRTSLLTGRRPDTTHVWQISGQEYWRQVVNATSLPQYFKQNGYVTIGMGKVFHPGSPSGNDDKKYSWSPEGLPYYHSPIEHRYGPMNKTSIAWAAEGFEDNQLPDGQIADNALKVLQELKQNRTEHGETRPFFMAVGFHKPHIPFIAPKKYFDMYPPQDQIAVPKHRFPPTDLPYIAWSVWPFFHTVGGVAQYFTGTECFTNASQAYTERCMMPINATQYLRRSYYSAMTYTDAQVGKVMDKMEEMGFDNDTIVVLWGDHGWQLGEHGEWGKYTNFEDGTHVPFMLRVPGVTDEGMRTKALVELIDIYPTLAELTGLPAPPLCPPMSQKVGTCVEGVSTVPLFHNTTAAWKEASFSQYARPLSGLPSIPGHPPFPKGTDESVMGYTMRTDKYRYTEWVKFNHTTAVADWTDVWGRELYDHTLDSEELFDDENENLVDKPEMAELVKKLHANLREGWRAAMPASMRT